MCYKIKNMKTTLSVLFLLFSFIVTSQSLITIENEIFNTINNYKIKFNKNCVVINHDMSKSCEEHSVLMGTTEDLKHVSDFTKIIGKSEIIQYVVHSNNDFNKLSQKILINFLNSPSHKKNIEETSTLMGVGVYMKKIETVIDSETFTSYEVWVTIRFF